MKVLYDHQTFSLQEYGGISRIYTELIKPFNNKKLQTELSLLFSNNVYLKELRKIRYLNFIRKYDWRYKTPIIYNLNKQYSIYKIKSGNYNVFHPTYYDPYFLKHLRGKPFVLTVHDMIHEKLVSRYKELTLDKIMAGKKTLLKEAARIIAVSESTKNDIIEIFGIDRSKIEVIYLASSMKRIDLSQTEKLILNDYILFVGNRGIYKNFVFFLEAIVPLLSDHKEITVLCAGGGKFTEQENLFIAKLGLQNKITQVTIKNDNTFIGLYSNALCFVFPSLYEGFGIPVLEALSCGCPCALSNRSSLPEVGGEAAVYFNPEDTQSIYSTISQIINNKQLREEKVKKGYERVQLFSWDKTRKQTFQLYDTLI